MENELGLYVHIPFCKKKCDYCDFASFAEKENLINDYIESLLKEINFKRVKNKKIKTIYLGGGTPSYIEEKYIQEILQTIKENFIVEKNAEITIEVNPGTVNLKKLQTYKALGINRLSIGLQAAQNAILKEIGRIHTYEEFLKTYQDARKIFDNINVDLMFALPTQTIKDLQESLEKIVKLNPEHISVYSLILEEGTILYNKEASGKLKLPSEKTERQMYWNTKKYLEKNNYIHYEISNFAREGYESKHNMDCWNQKEYLGVGLGASSYINKKRFSNITNLNKYIENIQNNEFKKNIILEEEQDGISQMNEFILLGLRKIDGISKTEFYDKFKVDVYEKFGEKFKKLEKLNLITCDNTKIKLTSKGLDLANIVWEEFI